MTVVPRRQQVLLEIQRPPGWLVHVDRSLTLRAFDDLVRRKGNELAGRSVTPTEWHTHVPTVLSAAPTGPPLIPERIDLETNTLHTANGHGIECPPMAEVRSTRACDYRQFSNLVMLCWFHDRMVHEGGWRIEGDPKGELVFIAPDGRTFPEGPTPIRDEDPGAGRRLDGRADRNGGTSP